MTSIDDQTSGGKFGRELAWRDSRVLAELYILGGLGRYMVTHFVWHHHSFCVTPFVGRRMEEAYTVI